jgi:hypothetical protein
MAHPARPGVVWNRITKWIAPQRPPSPVQIFTSRESAASYPRASRQNFFIRPKRLDKRETKLNRHQIRISGERVTGAVDLTSRTPIIAAVRALLASGASPNDTLHVTCAECSVAR